MINKSSDAGTQASSGVLVLGLDGCHLTPQSTYAENYFKSIYLISALELVVTMMRCYAYFAGILLKLFTFLESWYTCD